MAYGRQKRDARRRLIAQAAVGRDRPRCSYCGVAISRHWRTRPDTKAFTMDHVIPKAHGGPLRHWNLLPACLPCNHARENQPLDEFIASLGDRATMTVQEARVHMAVARNRLDGARL